MAMDREGWLALDWGKGLCPLCRAKEERNLRMARLRNRELEREVIGIVEAKGPCRFGEVLSALIPRSNHVYSSDAGEALCCALGDGRLLISDGGVLRVPETTQPGAA